MPDIQLLLDTLGMQVCKYYILWIPVCINIIIYLWAIWISRDMSWGSHSGLVGVIQLPWRNDMSVYLILVRIRTPQMASLGAVI